MVEKTDGNIGFWLGDEQAVIAQLSAKDIGLSLTSGWYERFERSLHENPDARRLVDDLLPKCNTRSLAEFTALVASTGIQDALIGLTRKRGVGLKKIVRPAARKARRDEDVRKSAEGLLARADRAFDTRREGLAEYCFGGLILRRYVQFRSGHAPTARELAALLKSGLAASGRPAYQRVIDHDLLRRNLRNYEKKHPLTLATGERCAEIIEAVDSLKYHRVVLPHAGTSCFPCAVFSEMAVCGSVTPAPILISRKGAAALLSISLGMLDKLARQGTIEPVRLGRKVMYRRDAIEELALPRSRRRLFHNVNPAVRVQ